MNDAVFISDLHLSPHNEAITEKFYSFLAWARQNTRSVYILGDFFHAWPGDDAMDDWSLGVLNALADVAEQGVKIFFMFGNRDFLVGQASAKKAQFKHLHDPSVILLDGESVLVSHGDRYCTGDWRHQLLMKFTRNAVFTKLFLGIPLRIRIKIVSGFRQFSQTQKTQRAINMDTVPASYLKEMNSYGVKKLIHGHTHKPGMYVHPSNHICYVLSDWDTTVQILCFKKEEGFYFLKYQSDWESAEKIKECLPG